MCSYSGMRCMLGQLVKTCIVIPLWASFIGYSLLLNSATEGTHRNRPDETILMSTNNKGFGAGVKKLSLQYPSLSIHLSEGDTSFWNNTDDMCCSKSLRSEFSSSCLGNGYYTRPLCVDHPTGYGCDCGPGFHWNTNVCMSTAVDSRLEFKKQSPVRFTLLIGKAFPKLTQFTIAFWIKIQDPVLNGTILSYKHGTDHNVLYMRSGPLLAFNIWNKTVETNFAFEKNRWYHMTWAWTSESGNYELYIDSIKWLSGRGSKGRIIPRNGEFVLGQASRKEFNFDEKYAFVGDLTHLNIWSFRITETEVAELKASCDMMSCGDAIQWTEFRSGTRGAMNMRWPSGVINLNCFSEDNLGITCNKFCSDTIGAQCNEQIVENIRWTRTKAQQKISVICPIDALASPSEIRNTNATGAYGTRPCRRTDDNEGEWGPANIDECISSSLRQLKYEKHLLADYIGESKLLELGRALVNHTRDSAYGNPVDIATVIDLLKMLVNTQAHVIVLDIDKWTEGTEEYARASDRSPTLDETKEFMAIVSDITNNLLYEKHEYGWNATKPPGVEGDNLMKVMETFAHVLSRSLQHHITDGEIAGTIGFEEAHLKSSRHEIELSIESQWIQYFSGVKFPSTSDASYGIGSKLGWIDLPKAVTAGTNSSDVPEFIKIASMRFRGMAAVLPNHDARATGIKAKEDNVNTPIIAMFLHGGEFDTNRNLSSPIIFSLPYLNNFNISNPECVRLIHGTILPGRWTRDGCELREVTGREGAVCACYITGIFAITTDMYDEHWNKGEVRPILMNFASYIGCCASVTLCLATCILLIYYRTSSSTASLHRNLGLSVVFGQLVFMIGIDRYEEKLVCQLFAIFLHYFFLCNFTWLMNEAFNLYIVITYSSHAHGGHPDSGSLLRYYILGWVLPAVMVGAFVGSQGELYYDKDMCWISWENIWLFAGPAIGIITVTIMVLIFTAKEHNENSYTKSEKSNKFIMLLMKALWTQIILITVVWSFAFISLKMNDRIIKYIFGLFNFLQGAFFIVFYLLLNEEVQNIFKSKKKKKTLTAHGFDEMEDRSFESSASTHLVEKDRLETLALDPRPRRRKDNAARQKRRQQGDKVQPEAPQEDDRVASDCEMITSV